MEDLLKELSDILREQIKEIKQYYNWDENESFFNQGKIEGLERAIDEIENKLKKQ